MMITRALDPEAQGFEMNQRDGRKRGKREAEKPGQKGFICRAFPFKRHRGTKIRPLLANFPNGQGEDLIRSLQGEFIPAGNIEKG